MGKTFSSMVLHGVEEVKFGKPEVLSDGSSIIRILIASPDFEMEVVCVLKKVPNDKVDFSSPN